MPAKPVTAWISAYEPGIKKHYDKQSQGIDDKIESFWKKWIDDNGQGLEVIPPYATKATSDPNAIQLKLEGLKTPVQTAKALADAWKFWYTALKFSPPAPAPPFSVIAACVPSQLGITVAYAALFSGLIAELTKTPPSADGAFAMKATAFGTLFWTATGGAGVMLSGASLSVPPVPLVLPLIPAK